MLLEPWNGQCRSSELEFTDSHCAPVASDAVVVAKPHLTACARPYAREAERTSGCDRPFGRDRARRCRAIEGIQAHDAAPGTHPSERGLDVPLATEDPQLVALPDSDARDVASKRRPTDEAFVGANPSLEVAAPSSVPGHGRTGCGSCLARRSAAAALACSTWSRGALRGVARMRHVRQSAIPPRRRRPDEDADLSSRLGRPYHDAQGGHVSVTQCSRTEIEVQPVHQGQLREAPLARNGLCGLRVRAASRSSVSVEGRAAMAPIVGISGCPLAGYC